MDMHPRALDHTQSRLDRPIPNESELTAGVLIEPGRSYGFFTDTTVCIGCKACEVACKEWNNLPADNIGLTGQSYDNTGALSANTWRHVSFVEKSGPGGVRDNGETPFQSGWLMMSDVCKHCHNAPCLEACPTGALFHTEFGTVVVQQDICNGCGYCVSGCPYGVIDRRPHDGRAQKCTLCYDRLHDGMDPACAQACPPQSIQFGELDELRERADRRVAQLHDLGVTEARLYGHDPNDGVGGDGAFFLLLDEPEVYGLPPDPVVPTRDGPAMWKRAGAAGAAFLAAGIGAFVANAIGGRR